MALPPEVWGNVIEEASKSDLIAIARVSPLFRVMATHRLYEFIELSFSERKTIRLLTTLCSNALAAQSVKGLSIFDDTGEPNLRSFFCLAIRALSALCNLQRIRYMCVYIHNGRTRAPPAASEILTHCTFPSLEHITIPCFLGLACFKKHQKTLRYIMVRSETSKDVYAQIFDHQFDFPVLEHITLSGYALPSLLSKSHLPSLNSIFLKGGINIDHLEAIRAFFAGSRSGTQIEQFKLRLEIPSADIWVIDMISNKLPRLASLEIYCKDVLDLDLSQKTIELIIPKLSRFTQLQSFVWDERLTMRSKRRETSYTDQFYAYVVDIGSRCPALRTCTIIAAWKHVTRGLWVPRGAPLPVQAAQWVFDKIRSESGYPGLVEHLETYSGSNSRVRKALFEYQTIQDDHKRIMPLMKVGEELGLWAFSPGFEAKINT